MKRKIFSKLLMGAFLIASVSMFVSCKDYDDDISKNAADIAALQSQLNSQLTSLRSDLTSQLSTAQSDVNTLKTQLQSLQNEIGGKADASTVSSLQSDLTSALARVAALEAQIKAIDDCASKSDVEAIAATVASLTGDMSTLNAAIGEEAAARVAVENNLKIQEEALAALQTKVATLEAASGDKAAIEAIEAEIKALQDAIKAFALSSDLESLSSNVSGVSATVGELSEKVSALSTSINELSEKINGFDANINVLTVLVNRSLNSISLVPQLFIDGIEAIEFNSLQYIEVAPGTSGKIYKYINNVRVPETLIDNGTAAAYYRLNPAIVERESLDEENIEFLAATAKTRAATVASPVTFNGIADWNYAGQRGLIKVNLKKNITTSLNNPPSGDIYIVALKVPRKADAEKGVEAADIVSENSRLVENVITPKIARLPWKVSERLNLDGTSTVNVHHYSDSADIWKTSVDANPLQLVYSEVNYNETFDLLSHVTGCKQTTDVIEAAHTTQAADELTKETLKSYGLTFRFAIPTTAYGAPNPNDVDHYTNQQRFATVDPVTGIVSSKLPDGVTDNRACVGKEPIVRIMLVDTLNNKLVDERYMKIKWVEQLKKPVTLETYKTTTILKPCDVNISGGINWEWFITKVYAIAEANGLSQQTFETVYNVRNAVVTSVTPNYNSVVGVDVLSPVAAPGAPTVQITTNERGDALIADWSLTPQEIARIYPSQSKVFAATITFKSSLPTEYPDLILPWEWTINLPELPAINGYYDNYWYTKYELHDVMPVQYNTALYNQIKNGTVVPQGGDLETYNKANNLVYPGTDYCVYYNNLMNAFTYEQINNAPMFIVKNLGKDCGTWDMQFTKAGSDRINSAVNYTQYPNYAPKFGSDLTSFNAFLSPNIDKESFTTFDAYRLYRTPWTTTEKQALQMVWDEGHVSWCGNPAHKEAILYADHNNDANQALINPLADYFEEDGITPARTHDKKIHIGIWGTLNDWNIIPVKDYDICLVAPIRIDTYLSGAFEEGYVSGTCVNCDDAFTMTDFRGYEVAKTATTKKATEWNKYRVELYKYYEIGEPVWNLNDVRYGMAWDGSNIKADDNKTYANALTAADIRRYTNDNIVLSVERKQYGGKWYLVFKNNGGSNVEEEVNVFIPVTVTYGFGSITQYAKVRLYPKGQVPSNVKITPYPGNN